MSAMTRTVNSTTAVGVPTPAPGGSSNTWMNLNLNAFRGGVGLIAVARGNGLASWSAAFSVLVCGQNPRLSAQNVITANEQFPFGTIYGYHDVLKSLVVTNSALAFVNWNDSLAYPCTSLALNVTVLTPGADVSLSIIEAVG